MHLLYLTAEEWPTFRQDVVALFGKYLPRYGITSDLVTERDDVATDQSNVPWGGGQAILCDVPLNRAGQYLTRVWHSLKVLWGADASRYDAVQVRDMTVTALMGLLMARWKGIKFFYWLSYPQSEGQIERAKTRGIKAGMRFWFPLVQGVFGKWLLYRIVLPHADHVFVQSGQMKSDLAQHGIPPSKMTPVPMGVDMELVGFHQVGPSNDARLVGRQVVAYLGTLDQTRQIEVLFYSLSIVKESVPDILLVLVGDSHDPKHRAWLDAEAKKVGVADHVIWTGWLPILDAWSYVRAAEIGISPFPRGYLLDSASPTKAVEYMALGLPVVANDNPDQLQVIQESAAGICVPYLPGAFAGAIVRLLNDVATRQRMGASGREYVSRVRSYDRIALGLSKIYLGL